MDIVKSVRSSLDVLKRISNNGNEYWTARDLQQPLGYKHWKKFESVIKKAKMACESTGVDSSNHFYPAVKMVDIGSDARRELNDYYVSRYAAYLIAMKGIPGYLKSQRLKHILPSRLEDRKLKINDEIWSNALSFATVSKQPINI